MSVRSRYGSSEALANAKSSALDLPQASTYGPHLSPGFNNALDRKVKILFEHIENAPRVHLVNKIAQSFSVPLRTRSAPS